MMPHQLNLSRWVRVWEPGRSAPAPGAGAGPRLSRWKATCCYRSPP